MNGISPRQRKILNALERNGSQTLIELACREPIERTKHVVKHLKRQGQIKVESWVLLNNRWNAVYALGKGEDPPKPSLEVVKEEIEDRKEPVLIPYWKKVIDPVLMALGGYASQRQPAY